MLCFTGKIGKRKITYTVCSRDRKNYLYFSAITCFINDRIPSSIKLEIVGIHIFFYHFITFNLWFSFFFMKYIFYYHFIVVKAPIIFWWINSGRNRRNPFWRCRKKNEKSDLTSIIWLNILVAVQRNARLTAYFNSVYYYGAHQASRLLWWNMPSFIGTLSAS